MADKVTRCIKVDPKVWEALRIRSIKEGRTASEIVESLIRQYLGEVNK